MVFTLLAIAMCGGAAPPTIAPTWKVKDANTVELLKKCAASLSDSSKNEYVEPAATKTIQNYRKPAYDLRENLATLPDLLDFSEGYPDFPYAYTSVIVVLALPGILFAILGVLCCFPCYCMKTCGEITACCCKGQGCCGTCNDYICGCRACPYPSGLCRWGPVGEYGTFFPFSKFQRNPNLQGDEKSGCGLCAGTPLELEEGESYHERDDYFSARKKPMEKRLSIPNIVWLIVIVLCGALICAMGVWGSIQLGGMITGLQDAVEEGNCVVEDGLNLIEEVNKPLANISRIASSVAADIKVTVSDAGTLKEDFKLIRDLLKNLEDDLDTNDPCNFGAATWTTTEVDRNVANTGQRYPSTDMLAAAGIASTVATSLGNAQGGVDELATTLTTVEGIATGLNTSVQMAVGAADAILAGPMVDLMKDTVRPINSEISGYLGTVKEYQGYATIGLFVAIFVVVVAIVVVSVLWLALTEFYECAQKKGEAEINAALNGEIELSEKNGAVEASGDEGGDDATYTVNAEPLNEDTEVEAVGTCGDCMCTIFQISSIWVMHVLHFIGWVIMMLTFIAAAFFSPFTVLVSDACTIIENVADHPTTWLSVPVSPVANMTLALDLASACLDVNDGNVMKALGVAGQLGKMSSMDLGNGTDIDVDSLFTFDLSPLETAVNALSNSELGWSNDPEPLFMADQRSYMNNDSPVTSLTIADCTGSMTNYNDGKCDDPSWSISKKDYRDKLMAMTNMRVCTSDHLQSTKTLVADIKTKLDNFVARTRKLSNDLKTTVPGAMVPINENIAALQAQGSCSFIRKRLNGALTSVCGPFLAGSTAMAINLTLIAFSFLVILSVMSNCAITRFRMYDVACWQHNATKGCSGAPEAEESASVAPYVES